MQLGHEQLDELADRSRASFRQRLHAHLAAVTPEWGAEPDKLPAFIDAGLRQADLWKIDREIDVVRFLELLWQLGPVRWRAELPWVQEYLGERRSAEERLDIVIERLQFGAGARA